MRCAHAIYQLTLQRAAPLPTPDFQQENIIVAENRSGSTAFLRADHQILQDHVHDISLALVKFQPQSILPATNNLI
jgi:hypothetical protein